VTTTVLEERIANLTEALRVVEEGFNAYWRSHNRLEGLGELLNRERCVREALTNEAKHAGPEPEDATPAGETGS
jgi:signal transduction histidine kinase